MLPHEDLKPLYEKMVWLWVFRDFKDSKEEHDAARTMDRFGLTTYPNLLFVEPKSNKVLMECGRGVKDILSGADQSGKKVEKPDSSIAALEKKMKAARDAIANKKKKEAGKILRELAKGNDAGEFHLEARDLLETLSGGERKYKVEDLKDADFDRRAAALVYFEKQLDKTGFVKGTVSLLDDPDAAVRVRAVRYVAKAAPNEILERAARLLSDPSDGVKWQTLDLLAKEGDPAEVSKVVCDAWKKLNDKKITSHNPNVFRLKMAGVLGDKGDADAIDVLREQATDGNWRSTATRFAVDAVGKIGKRHDARKAADVLIEAFPPSSDDEKEQQYLKRLVEAVHNGLSTATGIQSVATPGAWDEKARSQTVADWKKALKRK